MLNDDPYSFPIPNLRLLRSSMYEVETDVHVFDFVYNEVNSKALFQTDTDPFLLSFIKMHTGETLRLNIVKPYKVQISKMVEQEIRAFFNLANARGFFDYRKFADYINSRVPRKAAIEKTAVERRAIALANHVEEADKIYFMDLLNWEEINKTSKGNPRHRTQDNLAKTKLLYPEIYMVIKDHDISVCYTSDPQKAKC